MTLFEVCQIRWEDNHEWKKTVAAHLKTLYWHSSGEAEGKITYVRIASKPIEV
jgi:hypothetical protein